MTDREDVRPPAKSLIETLDPTRVGAIVEGPVFNCETEDSDDPTDGEVAEIPIELYDEAPVGSTVETVVI